MSLTEEDVTRIVLSLKSCLDPSHIACSRCDPRYDEYHRQRLKEARERLFPGLSATLSEPSDLRHT